jgi:hypothetical protein
MAARDRVIARHHNSSGLAVTGWSDGWSDGWGHARVNVAAGWGKPTRLMEEVGQIQQKS